MLNKYLRALFFISMILSFFISKSVSATDNKINYEKFEYFYAEDVYQDGWGTGYRVDLKVTIKDVGLSYVQVVFNKGKNEGTENIDIHFNQDLAQKIFKKWTRVPV